MKWPLHAYSDLLAGLGRLMAMHIPRATLDDLVTNRTGVAHGRN